MDKRSVTKGTEDKFYYEITEACICCGSCEAECPAGAISLEEDHYRINPTRCIDCGTCSSICPVSAARSLPVRRESIRMAERNQDTIYFNPGCAMSLYKPELPEKLLLMLQEYWGSVRMHRICCRHDPGLPKDSTIINNCAGCDRRFRSLYDGIETISLWEVLDSIPDLPLPDYHGQQISVHDSCGYRHKPQVHRAIRSLLQKMNLEVIETEFSGEQSICCGDNYYGAVPNNEVEARIRMRADQFPCDQVVVYCIGCVRAMESGGKTPRYLPDLILGRPTKSMPDSLDAYHTSMMKYIEAH